MEVQNLRRNWNTARKPPTCASFSSRSRGGRQLVRVEHDLFEVFQALYLCLPRCKVAARRLRQRGGAGAGVFEARVAEQREQLEQEAEEEFSR